jgi:hypothetical protein
MQLESVAGDVQLGSKSRKSDGVGRWKRIRRVVGPVAAQSQKEKKINKLVN